MFDEAERGPSDTFRLQFEAVSQLLEGELAVVREVLEADHQIPDPPLGFGAQRR